MSRLHLDFETASRVNLKHGASRYASDPSTQVLCVAFAYDDGPVKSILKPRQSEIEDLLAPADSIHCWNASFERAVLRHRYGLLPENFICSMQRSLYAGYPAALDKAAEAMNSPFTKDLAGRRLMLKLSKPRSDGTFWHDDPAVGPTMLQGLISYCKQDVEVERALAEKLPYLPATEEKLSTLDEVVNQRGIGLDIPLIKRLMQIAEEETLNLNARCAQITNGMVTWPGTQSARLKDFFKSRGFELDSVDKEAISELLDNAIPDLEIPPDVLEIASIRRRVAKSSTKKLQKMLDCAESDHRVRGSLMYYGAHTGRWSGQLLQPQNMPSRNPMVKKAHEPISWLLKDPKVDADGIRLFHGEPMHVVSACLRGCLVPTPGNVFLVFDYSQIEARCLAWIAGQHDLLKVFESGADVYSEVARQFGLASRDAGKTVVLGLGYGMGARRFVDYAKTYNVHLDPYEAQSIVDTWRAANLNITLFWRALGLAAMQVVRMPRLSPQIVHGLTLRMEPIIGWVPTIGQGSTGTLTIELPSGHRKLHYHNPRIVPDTNGRDSIVFDGLDDKNQWVPIRTWGAKLAENVCQAVARDILCEAAMRVEKKFSNAGMILSVHDELVFEALPPLGLSDVEDYIVERPDWAPTLPVAAEGKVMKRYGK